jgi:hypothetical protein
MTTETFELEGERWVIRKDPDAIKDYDWIFDDWLGTDTITQKTVVQPPGATMTVQTSVIVSGAKRVKVWLAGGTRATPPAPPLVEGVTVRIVTLAGRTEDQTLYFRIKDR